MPPHHPSHGHMHHLAMYLAATWAMSLCPSQLHMPLRRAPSSHTRHLAAPLMATHAMSLHPSQMHASCCHPSHSHMCHITVPHLAAHAMSLPPLVATCTASPHLLQPYVPHCCTPPSYTHHITTPSRGCMHCITTPPAATHATSLHPTQLHMPRRHPLSWLHTPCCRTSHSHTHHVTMPHPAACTTSPPLSWPMVCSSCRIVLYLFISVENIFIESF